MSIIHLLWLHKATLLCLPALLYFVGGVAIRLSVSNAWRIARAASGTALFFSLACCCYALQAGSSLAVHPCIDSTASVGNMHLSFRFDLIASLMLLLVSFLGWVIVSYSNAYMAGDPRELSYISRLMQTLAAVLLLVVTNSLVVFAVAWIVTGFTLHGLLTLYPNRQAAVIAAHKKFLASCLGDIALLGGVLLLENRTGSFEIDRVVDHVLKLHTVPFSIQISAILLAVSAIIKCAQLPLHGWLIQVMEAPTPVSALLHAGVINIGGFMLIRLATVIDTTPAAQVLLVLVGCLTAVICSLVMATRISIKVHLAWSTCAQMGFMLMECGLGLYRLAFLHLLAHSLYKAHAFLGSGGAVNEARIKSLALAIRPPKLPDLLVGSLCGLIVAALSRFLLRPSAHMDVAAVFCLMVAGFAVARMLTAASSMRTVVGTGILAAAAFTVSTLYFGYDEVFRLVVPEQAVGIVKHPALFSGALAAFGLLYVIQTTIRMAPLGRLATAMYPWLYAGLYLDEIFTRVTFRLWPAANVGTDIQRRDAENPFNAAKRTFENAR